MQNSQIEGQQCNDDAYKSQPDPNRLRQKTGIEELKQILGHDPSRKKPDDIANKLPEGPVKHVDMNVLIVSSGQKFQSAFE
jgi:hypothetical protein